MRKSDSLVTRAQRMGGAVRSVVDALRSPRPDIALARHQFAAVRAESVVARVRSVSRSASAIASRARHGRSTNRLRSRWVARLGDFDDAVEAPAYYCRLDPRLRRANIVRCPFLQRRLR